MSWNGCEGGPGTDLDGIRWYGRSGMSMEGLGLGEESLGLGWRALSGCKGPKNSLGVKDGYGGFNMGVNGLDWVWIA